MVNDLSETFDDKYNMNDGGTNSSEVDDFFARFDRIKDEYRANAEGGYAGVDAPAGTDAAAGDTVIYKAPAASGAAWDSSEMNAAGAAAAAGAGFAASSASSAAEDASGQTGSAKPRSTSNRTGGKNTKKKKKKKRKLIFRIIKWCFLILIVLILIAGAVGYHWLNSIIKDVPDINPDDLYSLLTESSTIYDDEGNVLESVFTTSGNRTNVSYSQLPDNLVNAFVAVEDKTFWEHKGFNFVRIVGAIKEAVFNHNEVSGTSTLTQQLARNLYLTDEKSVRSMRRKIAEAYYTNIIETELTKEQILEAYMNTIFLGFNSDGVDTAAHYYFNKDVQDLDLLECAALAALPQQPTTYALIKKVSNESVAEDDEDIILRTGEYSYIYNGDVSKDRRDYVLRSMCEQGKISEAERDAALADDLRLHMNPCEDATREVTSYFIDYAIEQVINDLMEEFGYSYDDAYKKLYSGGLKVYTTVNQKIQNIVETEFVDSSNFPTVAKLNRDGNGNILNPKNNNSILLYKYSNVLDEEGTFLLTPSEYAAGDNGSLVIFKGGRLNFYKTTVQGEIDYSVEFKNMYTYDDNVFYYIGGGVLAIPQKYKDRDDDGNLIISADFFRDYPNYFKFVDAGIAVTKTYEQPNEDGTSSTKSSYSLKQKVLQPQAAMVITDYSTGAIKAMVGGRGMTGRMLYNRADNPRQPGSSIKPMAVYSAALQKSVEAYEAGTSFPREEGTEGILHGDYWTAGSVIDDSPLVVNGRTWPKNWYSGYRGLYTLRQAVEQSVNVVAVKVMNDIGVEYARDMLKKYGVTTVVESGDVNDMNPAALALGGMSNGISPLEMVGGYGVFGNQGTYIEPIAYTRITNNRGEVLLENVPETREVLDPGVAFIMTDILRTTVSNGIAGKAAIGSQPVAGKTGTTTDNYDAWFVGLTPQYAAAMWIGNDVNIELSQGSAAAASMWSRIMKQVCDGLPAGQFKPKPDNVISVTIDTKSGMLATEWSSHDPRGTVRGEYFVRGTQPTGYDTLHEYAIICEESGYLATPYCEHQASFLGTHRPYEVNESVGDIGYEIPRYYCHLHNLNTALYPTDPNATVTEGYVWEWDGVEHNSTLNPDGTINIPEPEVTTDGGVDMNGDGMPDDQQGWSSTDGGNGGQEGNNEGQGGTGDNDSHSGTDVNTGEGSEGNGEGSGEGGEGSEGAGNDEHGSGGEGSGESGEGSGGGGTDEHGSGEGSNLPSWLRP